MTKPPEWLDLGQVVTTVGVKGELKLRPDTDDPLRLRELASISALLADGTREVLCVERVVARKDGVVLVKFAGYDAPETAAKLRRAVLQIPFAEAKREPGKVLYADVLGMAVVDEASGAHLGTVSEVLRAGQDLLEIRKPDGETVLVPWVEAFVTRIDQAARTVYLQPIEGLLT